MRVVLGTGLAGLFIAFTLAPGPVGAQTTAPWADADLQVDHDPVSCLVAGKHPRLLACFSPASKLARGRVYFRAHGTPDWFFVNMTADAPCFIGILPKPTKEIEKVDYYVEAMGREFTETLTPEYDPIVVDDESECEGILAAFLDKAKVVVGSAGAAVGVPQGFLASGLAGTGVSTGLVAGVVGAGAAVAGVAVVAGGDEADAPPAPNPPVAGPPPAPAPTPPPAPPPAPDPGATPTPDPGPTPTPSPGPTPTPSPGPTPTPSPGPTTTTTTTTMPPNRPPTGVFNVSPTSGESPLRVTFNMCGSSDPDGDSLEFSIVYGDGANYVGSNCNPPRHRYTAPEDVTRFYSALVCVTDGHPGHDVCRTFVIRVEGDDFRDSAASHGDPADGPRQSMPTPVPTPGPAPPDASGGVSLGCQLTVPGATGQVVLNGLESFFVGAGWTRLAARGRPESNRVEALLVDGKGTSGQWRFDLSGTRLEIDGLRVIAGQTISISPREVVFALSGHPAERIVFSFQLSATR